MNKTKIIFLSILLISCLIVFAGTVKADFTDYCPEVGVLKVEYVSHIGANFTFDVVLPDGTSQRVSGGLDENGRGVPDLSGITDGPLADCDIEPPSRPQESASIIDSSERRIEQFRETHRDALAKNILIGYDEEWGTLLLPDHNASVAEILTVGIRSDAALRGDTTYIIDPNLAWEEVLREFGEEAAALRDLTIDEAQERLSKAGLFLIITDRNGDGVVQRGELLFISPAPDLTPDLDFDLDFDPAPAPAPTFIPAPPPLVFPVCTSFSSNRQRILYNQRAELQWSCIDIDYCSISPDVIGQLGAFGSRSVSPRKTTTYTLTCYRGNQATSPLSTTIEVYEIILEETGVR